MDYLKTIWITFVTALPGIGFFIFGFIGYYMENNNGSVVLVVPILNISWSVVFMVGGALYALVMFCAPLLLAVFHDNDGKKLKKDIDSPNESHEKD